MEQNSIYDFQDLTLQTQEILATYDEHFLEIISLQIQTHFSLDCCHIGGILLGYVITANGWGSDHCDYEGHPCLVVPSVNRVAWHFPRFPRLSGS